MNEHRYSALNGSNVAAEQQLEEKSFAMLLRNTLGEPAWARLDAAIAARFSGNINNSHSLHFVGKMHWVYYSPLGALIAKLIKRFSILPGICARDTDFFFNISMQNAEIIKRRCYELGKSSKFIFNSSFSDQPRLHEEFGGGIGMYLRLAVKRGALLFRDQGYFLRIRHWRIPLPSWLTVGKFDLLHRSIDAQRFQIIIRVAHPLFGTLFYQRGEFEKANIALI